MRKIHWMRSKPWTAATLAALLAWGCRNTHKDVSFLGEADQDHYRTHATAIQYPNVVTETPVAIRDSLPPRTLDSKDRCEIREIHLTEAVHIGMSNSEIVKSGGQFLSAGNTLLTSSDRVLSSYDSAIQESGVLFGGRGVEAALSDFDAQLNSSMTWGRSEVPNNVAVPGSANVADLANFNASLSKTFANGGQASFSQNTNYLNATGAPTSTYAGNVGFEYRLPLLAGAGTEFTRIAGPITRSFGGITGVSQGVVVARINNDLVLCDYENALRNLNKDIEDAYWDLYLSYRLFDTATQAYESALATWRIANVRVDEGDLKPADGAQAKDQLFAARAAVDSSRSGIYTTETALRRLIGLPVNDGQVLRPAEEPITAQFIPDWHHSVGEALTQRVELRRQKWNIRSLDLQLHAARSLTRPRLDMVSQYQVNALGDSLVEYGAGGNSFYQGLSGRKTDGWGAGVEMTMPVGLRSAHAQVQNFELRLTKAHKALQVSEEEVAQELAVAFQEISRSYCVAKTNLNRFLAAQENARLIKVEFDLDGKILLDEVLRSQLRRAQAQQAYYESLTQYNKSITNLYYRKGTLLAYNNIRMAEGGWTPEAYQDADRLHGQRAHGHEIDVDTEPSEFVSPVPVGRVDSTTYVSDAEESQPSTEEEPMIESAPDPAANEDAVNEDAVE